VNIARLLDGSGDVSGEGAGEVGDQAPGMNPRMGLDLHRLPPTLTVEQAAAILGCGRTLAYELVRRGDFPSRVIRLGSRRYVIPTADLLRVIGIDAR
jgi:excisionase family DNA binding protein